MEEKTVGVIHKVGMVSKLGMAISLIEVEDKLVEIDLRVVIKPIFI